jgi:gas vesicle structural protein
MPARDDVAIADRVLEPSDATVLDMLDRLLDKGVMVNGDVTLGVAGVDLIYVRLSALLCAADYLLPPPDRKRRAGDARRPRRRARRRS